MTTQDWKQKYLDCLDRLETHEKQWRSTETLLKQGLTRVALAAQGLAPDLDDNLTRLRKTIRGDIDQDHLEAVIEDLSGSVKHLDEQRSGKIVATRPQDLLSHWLGSLSFPRELNTRLDDLRRTIGQAANIAQMEAPLRQLAALVNEALHHESGGGKSKSLFQRLFGGSEASPSESPCVGLPLSDFCIQLLDTLSLPAELSDEVEALKDRLAEGLPDDAIASTLTAIADLISAMRRQMESENKELQDFLRQLTEHLQDIDQNLAGTQSQQRAATDSGYRIGAEVHAQVKHIETTVEAAPESSQLKQQIQTRLDAIRAHLDEYQQVEEERQQQLEERLTLLNTRIHSMESEGEQLRRRLQEKHEQAVHDPLTGLYNRLAYDERMTQELARWKRYNQPLVLMVIDVDHFKQVNDRYGHKAGDKALTLIADQLRNNLRESDFLARFGGEEFVVLMPGTELDPARVAADKLLIAVKQCQFHYQAKQVPITISAGLAQLREGDNSEKFFQRADQAMYRAKAAGRNCCLTENDT